MHCCSYTKQPSRKAQGLARTDSEVSEHGETELSMPRICPKQTLRENYKTETAKDCYRAAASAQFLDHIESQLSMGFDQNNLSVIKGFVIILELMRKQITLWKDDFLGFAGQYKNDFLSERILKAEMDMRETYWLKKHVGVIPDRVSIRLKMTRKHFAALFRQLLFV